MVLFLLTLDEVDILCLVYYIFSRKVIVLEVRQYYLKFINSIESPYIVFERPYIVLKVRKKHWKSVKSIESPSVNSIETQGIVQL